MDQQVVDPVTFEVIWHRLLDTAEEMGIKYMRTSGSPILVGAYDASTGITLPDGRLVAIGPYITTQAHVLPLIIRAVQDRCSVSPGIGDGDMFICNDPYLGATHQPDVATVSPAMHAGEMIGWVGASGHWIDIGGPEPGGFNMRARTVFDEGLRMPPTRVVDGGVVRDDVVGLIVNQIRDPMAELDLRGQIVANRTGTERLAILCDEYGPSVVTAVMEQSIDYVGRRLRERLATLPDGTWREVQLIDHDGHQATMRQIVCTLTKRGDHLSVDFTGTDPQAEGFVNCTFGGLRAAVMSALGICLGWDLPWNDGLAEAVTIAAPRRTTCTAEFPAPVSMATITPIILSLNIVFAGLAKMLLASDAHKVEAMANWCGTSLAPTTVGVNEDGVLTVNGETSHFAAGCGARTYADGVDTGGIVINTTASIPSIEAVESDYPVLYLMRRQLTDSGGPGRFRGGMAGEVALIPYHAQGPLGSSFAGCGAEVPNAFGTAGGLPGAAARFLRFHRSGSWNTFDPVDGLPASLDAFTGERVVQQLNTSHTPFPPETIEYHNWQGGGGYGDPCERDPRLVLRDALDGAVSIDEAERVYGVAIADDAVDIFATEARRDAIRQARLSRAQPADSIVSGWLEAAPSDLDSPGSTSRYGDTVVFDFEGDGARCLSCGHRLGDARSDFRRGSVAEATTVVAAGPARGQDYRTDRVRLILFYCPGCGRQLDCEVSTAATTRPGFVLGHGA